MIKEQRKYCYGVYTLMFFTDVVSWHFCHFFTEGKSFVWGAGVEDGLSQHFFSISILWGSTKRIFP